MRAKLIWGICHSGWRPWCSNYLQPQSTKLLGCLNQRSSDLMTSAALASSGEMIGVRCPDSNSFLFKHQSSLQNSISINAVLNCGVVFIMVLTEQSLVGINTAFSAVTRTTIGCNQCVFKPLGPTTGIPLKNGIPRAFLSNLCVHWLKSFIWRGFFRSRTFLFSIHHSTRKFMC